MANTSGRNMMRVFFLFLVVVVLIIVSPNLGYANVVWPGMFVVYGVGFLNIVVIGLVIEWPFVKIATGRTWCSSIVPTILMNAASSIFGGLLIILLSLILVEGVLPAIFNFNIFDMFDWIANFILAILINSIIESKIISVVCKIEKQKKLFLWLLFANILSITFPMIIVVFGHFFMFGTLEGLF